MEEKIGKVHLDLGFYKKDDRYSDGDETENRLLEIVGHYDESEYPEIIQKEDSWPLLYHLSVIRENILNWYPFRKGEKILELGAGCGAVTGAFLKAGMDVTAVDLSLRRCRINATRHREWENLKIIVGAMEEVMKNLREKFRYISLIGVLEYASVFSSSNDPFRDVLKMCFYLLKEDGVLLVAIENKLGLKYFAGCREDHTGRFFESIEGYKHRDGPRTFSRRELMNMAQECGFDCSFYYPYPDYKLPVKIFSDEALPKKGELTRNWQNFDADRVQLFDESLAFDSILDAGLFPDLSNSFLVAMRRRGSE